MQAIACFACFCFGNKKFLLKCFAYFHQNQCLGVNKLQRVVKTHFTYFFVFSDDKQLKRREKSENYIKCISTCFQVCVAPKSWSKHTTLNQFTSYFLPKTPFYTHYRICGNNIGNLNKQDRFTTCFKTCGTGSLLWRVGKLCKVREAPYTFKYTDGETDKNIK